MNNMTVVLFTYRTGLHPIDNHITETGVEGIVGGIMLDGIHPTNLVVCGETAAGSAKQRCEVRLHLIFGAIVQAFGHRVAASVIGNPEAEGSGHLRVDVLLYAGQIASGVALVPVVMGYSEPRHIIRRLKGPETPGCHDPKIVARAANSPEQIGVVRGVGLDGATICEDDGGSDYKV